MLQSSSSGRASKVCAGHLERTAYVYVRQSTPQQVQRNPEGRENQEALAQRAADLGWSPGRVRVVDADLGLSGKSTDGRSGFKELVSEVSLGHAGIVLSYEASRLARNNADWYALLDLCTLRGTLIADADGVYDPTDYNDRLLLGLRGMMSEAELHLLRMRMDAGKLRQVEKGTYRQGLPTGLVRLDDGRVVKHPDRRVRRAIGLVFERFEELGTISKVLKSLLEDGASLPRFRYGGPHHGELIWCRPTRPSHGRRYTYPSPERHKTPPTPFVPIAVVRRTCSMRETFDVATGRSTMRRSRKGALVAATATPVLFAIFGTALVGGSGLGWFDGLVKPWFLVPLWAFFLVGFLYYVLAAVVLYRILVHIDDPKGRAVSFALTVGVLFLNELWNYGFFGLRSTLAGFVGIAAFLVPLTALIVALRRYERFSAGLLVPYYLWVLYDLAWTYALWRLNGAA